MRALPITEWLPKLTRAEVRQDLVAGITVAVMIVPQGMAYAMLAGVPPITGLYAGIVSLVAYALLGTSRQLSVGPVAMVSMLCAAAVAALNPAGPAEFLSWAIVLALLVGLIQVGMGLLRLGFLVNFLAQPVLSGFTSAVAVIIGCSQLQHLFGVRTDRTHNVLRVLGQLWQQAAQVNPATFALGALSLVVLVLIKRARPRFPGALVVVVATTAAVTWGGLANQDVRIVGHVPAGFPPPALPHLTWAGVKALLPTALVIAMVGFIQSISVAKLFASKNRYSVNANQELVALGAANVAASLFSAHPVAGGFGRSAVNADAGAQSGLASLFSAAFLTVTILFLTPLFHNLPKAALAAIIMMAVSGLIDVGAVRRLWRVKRGDLVLLVLAFFATLSLGVELGIAVGVAASLAWFIIRTTRPHFAVLGRLENGAYRSLEHHPEGEQVPGICIVRMDAQFYFGNVDFLKDALHKAEQAADAAVHTMIIDASAMNQLDSSADAALHGLVQDYEDRGIRLVLAGVKNPVLKVLQRSGYIADLGQDHVFMTIGEAVRAAQAGQGPGGSEPAC